MTALYLVGSTFILVFALGFQSLNVNGGHYLLAFLTSLVIGVANLVLLKLAPNANAIEMAAFLAGGPFGIVASMWAHGRFVRRDARRPMSRYTGTPPARNPPPPDERPHRRTIR